MLERLRITASGVIADRAFNYPALKGFCDLLDEASPAGYVVLQVNLFAFGQTPAERVQDLLQRELVILRIRVGSRHDPLPGSAE